MVAVCFGSVDENRMCKQKEKYRSAILRIFHVYIDRCMYGCMDDMDGGNKGDEIEREKYSNL